MVDDCVFCKIADKQISADIVYENADVVAFRDLNPQAPVHILVIPKKHIMSIDGAGVEDSSVLGKMLLSIRDIAREENISEKGYRVVFNTNSNAGQEVFHVHAHILGGRKFTWPPG